MLLGCLHSLVLAVVDIGFIIVAYSIYYILKPINQIAVQAPVAAILCIFGFAAWSLVIRRFFKSLALQETSEFAWTYVGSLLWIPMIFVPLHYITQGYLTSFGNILGIWLFQLPVNLLAILAARRLAGPSKVAQAAAPDRRW